MTTQQNDFSKWYIETIQKADLMDYTPVRGCIAFKQDDYEGNKLWRYYVSGTISGMALNSDETTLLVGTYNGMLHIIDLTSTEPSPYEISTSSIRESYR
ncbi:PQQ-binding-like beta-propeller repeat protein [Lysinibacillus sp. NPDC059133]|uniref:PQQ-binding-like beta-propeller repeat protein n=1 Tax=Lysinibacillus sp. NPDC059133 TaxID=3346737 RepID=UPI0036B6C50E